MKIYLFIISLFFCSISFAQTSVSGSVKDSKNEPIPGANITVSGEDAGTVSDIDGNFSLVTTKKPPFEIKVSSVGYGVKTISVTSNNQKIAVVLDEEQTLLDEIVVSASRAPERLRESPVTIERFTAADVKKTASPTFYDGLENLKEVQMNTSSMSFKSINTRGFATVANTRFMQLVDGMDNSSPLLNFVLGNLIGVSDLDVASVELLPGASSALYGANAFNGILFMKSKNPFIDQGVSVYAKYGQTNQKAAGANEYYDYGVRVAHKFNDYFAAKANFTFMKGTEWWATDYDDKTVEGRDRSHPNYNGMNVYGDEASTNIKSVGQTLANMGLLPASAVNLLPNENVSRTGYNEVDLTDNVVKNAKVDFSLHFKPFKNDFEIIWQSKFGFGNSVYQGANRYYLNGFQMQQHKLELEGKNFFVRGYFTTEDGGNSYDMLFTGLNVNRAWKADSTWFGQYAGAYVQSTLAGATPEQAHTIARNTADTGRLIPGTPEFQNAFNQVISNPDVLSGSKLVDNSKIYHSDANYNFRDLIKFAEIQVGGSYRRYDLNSFGRIYTDTPQFGGIKYDEYGLYTQVQKKLMDDRLKFTGSVRYDKSDNFDGNYSPRVSLVYSAGENRNHVFRGSFQTGFRNPTTQDQYIGFNVGNAILLGSAPDNLTRYEETLPVTSPLGQALVGGTTTTIDGNNAYFNSYTAQSVAAFSALATSDPIAASALLVRTDVDLVKPETVKAFELGYRGQYEGFNIDINGYYNIYNDFIGNLTVLAPLYGTAQDAPNPLLGPTDPGAQSVDAIATGNYRAFQLYTNTDIEIKSLGFGVGVSKKLPRDFEISANYNYAQFDFDQAKDPSFEAGFNTPKHRVKGSISNDKLFKNFGFNVSARWSDEYLWESSFADGMIDAATVVDAQISYGIPTLKSVLKVGATNLGGKEYRQLLGPGLIGQQYFVSLTINP
ncbi:TonB-dependent receptor [Flavobacterium capsici]|uniref:TonB-dependent receptor n=1 Tax=Flavobacterium capsici TaxID=3075618 RepID=A0AA96F1S1_9FLAO|nr:MULTISPECIES: TonB-dependent receptor [unclassified Flavobacterium]WNM19796.1 TonB-dependent receptor [Flavobacterium sp. PMR2A8]WNM21185.1 TonB-dependent receptor [Flavobacterium sp. PMTSA4]